MERVCCHAPAPCVLSLPPQRQRLTKPTKKGHARCPAAHFFLSQHHHRAEVTVEKWQETGGEGQQRGGWWNQRLKRSRHSPCLHNISQLTPRTDKVKGSCRKTFPGKHKIWGEDKPQIEGDHPTLRVVFVLVVGEEIPYIPWAGHGNCPLPRSDSVLLMVVPHCFYNG